MVAMPQIQQFLRKQPIFLATPYMKLHLFRQDFPAKLKADFQLD